MIAIFGSTECDRELDDPLFISSRSSAVDLAEPSPKLVGQDDRELRARILRMTQSEARDLGIGKSTLHYLRKRTRSRTQMRLYSNTHGKLQLLCSKT